MGFLKNIFSNTNSSEQQFIDLVLAHNNSEEWARKEIQKMWESNDETLLPRMSRAETVIYKDAAESGDRDAIIKYATGLACSNRDEEGLNWFMTLINKGDTDAMLRLAHEYTQYGAMGENPEAEFHWISKAAEA